MEQEKTELITEAEDVRKAGAISAIDASDLEGDVKIPLKAQATSPVDRISRDYLP